MFLPVARVHPLSAAQLNPWRNQILPWFHCSHGLQDLAGVSVGTDRTHPCEPVTRSDQKHQRSQRK